MNQKYILPLLLAIDICILLFEASLLSVSYSEAHTYFGYHGVVGWLSHLFVPLFGENDIAIRLPMILLHVGSVLLLYRISKEYLKEERERLILLIVYMMLPGVISAALLVNPTGFVIFALFLFVYLFLKYDEGVVIYGVLGLYTLLDHTFFYLFLGLFFYALYKKRYFFAFYTFFLMGVSLYLFGTDIGGYPTGHFLDALAVYSAIFSPIVFIYIVYVLYRRFLTKKMDIVWFISTTALLFSLLLSLRQRVHLEFYAPYLLLALPLAAQTFASSYRVRLPRFRRGYKLIFNLALLFLTINFLLVLANRYIYLVLDVPKKHFAYDNNIAKELAQNLKKMNILCVRTDYKMQLRLHFYGIDACDFYRLDAISQSDTQSKSVTVSYISKPVYSAYVTKVNNK